MGLTRKLLSFGTFGLVKPHSTRELLASARADLAESEAGLRSARAELDGALSMRERLQGELAEARSRAEKLELSSIRDARRAEKRGRRKERLERAASRVVDTVGPAARAAEEAGERAVDAAGQARDRFADEVQPRLFEARVRGRRARHQAAAAGETARLRASRFLPGPLRRRLG